MKLKIKYDGIVHVLVPELMFDLYFINELIGCVPVSTIIDNVLALEGMENDIFIDLDTMLIEVEDETYSYEDMIFFGEPIA